MQTQYDMQAPANGGAGKARGGFTLIEVLIAVVILATGMVVVLEGLHASLNVLTHAVDKSRCAILLQDKLERVRTVVEQGDDPGMLGSAGAFESPYANYRWALETGTAVLSSPGAGVDAASGDLYEVEATVWRDGRERTYSVSTLIYQPPREDEGGVPEGGL